MIVMMQKMQMKGLFSGKSFHSPDYPIVSKKRVILTEDTKSPCGVIKPPLVRAHGKRQKIGKTWI